MAKQDWDLKRIYREIVVLSLLGLVSFIAMQMSDIRVVAQRVSAHDGALEKHEYRLDCVEEKQHKIELDVNTLKIKTSIK